LRYYIDVAGATLKKTTSKDMGIIMNKRTSRKQGGFTMIELVIGILIMAVGIAVIAPILNGLLNANVKASAEVSAMTRTVNMIDDRYYSEAINADLDNVEVIKAKLFAEAYRVSGDNIYNQFGGKITIVGVEDNGLVWTSEKITSEACINVVNGAKDLGFETVAVGGTTLKYSETTKAMMSDACNTTDDNLTVVWTREEA
jgi:prepilin-type N-terminal cleavage/methylation domain-containing protein